MSSTWEAEKNKFLQMSADEKQSFYRCGPRGAVPLEEIPTWQTYAYVKRIPSSPDSLQQRHLAKRVALWQGDITKLQVDAIVNAANRSLLGGGGVDGAIHRAAGSLLLDECRTLNGCDTGACKMSGAYHLPARHVIHTVGPVGEKPQLLASCYAACLDTARQAQLRSIAFPCISTGVYRYPHESACRVALEATRKWLDRNGENAMDLIVFCVFLDADLKAYERILPQFFPH